MTVQTNDGNIFDSIVFGEIQNRHWMSGSNNHARTKPFTGGSEELEAVERPVHLAISYHDDGTVVGYRDGERYGKPYKSTPPVEFKAGQSIVSFGIRHLPNNPDRCLAGRIERANLYDHALSDEQILESFQHWSDYVSDSQVLAALSEQQRDTVAQLKQLVKEKESNIAKFGPLPPQSDDQQAWTELTRTLLMLKEFIYVR